MSNYFNGAAKTRAWVRAVDKEAHESQFRPVSATEVLPVTESRRLGLRAGVALLERSLVPHRITVGILGARSRLGTCSGARAAQGLCCVLKYLL